MEVVPLAEGVSAGAVIFQAAASYLEGLQTISSLEWVMIVLCLLLSGMFSASETALTALNYTKLRQLLEDDPQRYGRLRLWLDRPNRVLTTILIGNNLVNILASALVTRIAYKIFGNQGVAIAVGVMTIIVLITGEILPKTYARYHARQVGTRLMGLLRLVYWLFLPFTIILVKIASLTVRLLGGKLSQSGPFVTEEDIEYMIDLGTREGVLDEHKEKLLQSILEFDDITIREVMVPRIDMIALSLEASAEEVTELARTGIFSRIPVYQGNLDNVIGILYLRDLLRQWLQQDSEELKKNFSSEFVASFLRPPYFVPGSMKISGLLREFQRRKNHMAIVVDEYGGTMGLVTLEDILEEIVGEIQDEYDSEEQEFLKTDEGTYQADARIPLRELEEYLDTEFPEDGGYETLGGFLTDRTGRVPQIGDYIDWEGFRFLIRDADDRRVRHVEIYRVLNPDLYENEEDLPDNLPEEISPSSLPSTADTENDTSLR